MADVWREKLRKYRRVELSRKIGVSRATIWAWLSGKAYPRPTHIQKIVEVVPEISYADFGFPLHLPEDISLEELRSICSIAMSSGRFHIPSYTYMDMGKKEVSEMR